MGINKILKIIIRNSCVLNRVTDFGSRYVNQLCSPVGSKSELSAETKVIVYKAKCKHNFRREHDLNVESLRTVSLINIATGSAVKYRSYIRMLQILVKNIRTVLTDTTVTSYLARCCWMVTQIL